MARVRNLALAATAAAALGAGNYLAHRDVPKVIPFDQGQAFAEQSCEDARSLLRRTKTFRPPADGHLTDQGRRELDNAERADEIQTIACQHLASELRAWSSATTPADKTAHAAQIHIHVAAIRAQMPTSTGLAIGRTIDQIEAAIPKPGVP